MSQVFIHLMTPVFTSDNTFKDVESRVEFFCTRILELVCSGTALPFDLLNKLVEGFKGLETGELALTIAETLL